MIFGFSKNDHPCESLMFNEMQIQGTKPNSITIASILFVCAKLLALEQGKQIQCYALIRDFNLMLL
jgi:hypothetical protein